jgi:glycosyltransferase involved in cell wall biosynthesis
MIKFYRMNVLLIRNAYQKDTGGAEQYLFNLGLAVKNSGHHPIVVTKHEAILKKCNEKNISNSKGLWYEKQSWDRLYYLRALYTSAWYIYVIISRRIDIVHPQSRDDFVFATWAARILRKNVFWTDHGDLKFLLDRKNHPHPRMQKWLLACANYTRKIICTSDSEKQKIIEVASELKGKLTAIHNGVFPIYAPLPAHKTKPVIGAISRLVPDKGIKEILEAFSKLVNFDGELWLVGSLSGNGEFYKSLATKLGVANRVKFVGYVNNSDNYLAQMDYFVHASYHESFGIAVAEACMAGLPIVATNVGGIPEIVESNVSGLLVPPKNSALLTEALQELISKSELASKLGQNAKKRAIENFDFQKIVEEQIIPLYKEALK